MQALSQALSSRQCHLTTTDRLQYQVVMVQMGEFQTTSPPTVVHCLVIEKDLE
jgi:hypothetical protein